MSNFNYQKICQEVLENLTPRQKEVIEKRFGLSDGSPETLQKIGDNFGITRERVRQIESESFSKLKKIKENKDLKRVFFSIQNYLENQGGAKREDLALRDLGKDDYQNHVRFFLVLGDSFHRHNEDEKVYPFWVQKENFSQKVEKIVMELFQIFSDYQKPLPENELLRHQIAKREPKIFLSSLEISKYINKGPLGEFGLVSWPEIKPRGVRDKAYLALKKEGRPLHFTQIAEMANQLIKGEKREIFPQTVHNELIRDERFVLVGRGKYALKEWGYKSGTVRDIIREILEEKGKPVPREEILREALQQREVKPNTIILALGDKRYFRKDPQGNYKIYES